MVGYVYIRRTSLKKEQIGSFRTGRALARSVLMLFDNLIVSEEFSQAGFEPSQDYVLFCAGPLTKTLTS